MRSVFRAVSLVVAGVLIVSSAWAQDAVPAPAKPKGVGYDNTPFLPDSEWRVHDSRRPHPPVIVPGTATAPPSDAIVLFAGKDLSQWCSTKKGGGPAAWKVEDGYFEVVAKTGTLATVEEFGSCQLHIEWAAPESAKGESQGRGNSGVILMGLYEIQVLDSYENVTYADGQAAAIYGQRPPSVNACRVPGEWQSYDILFTAPVFEDGKLVSPAYVTLLHNGVLVHNHVRLLGAVRHKQVATYRPHPPKAPLRLQDHGHPVRYRNVWLRPLGE